MSGLARQRGEPPEAESNAHWDSELLIEREALLEERPCSTVVHAFNGCSAKRFKRIGQTARLP